MCPELKYALWSDKKRFWDTPCQTQIQSMLDFWWERKHAPKKMKSMHKHNTIVSDKLARNHREDNMGNHQERNNGHTIYTPPQNLGLEKIRKWLTHTRRAFGAPHGDVLRPRGGLFCWIFDRSHIHSEKVTPALSHFVLGTNSVVVYK